MKSVFSALCILALVPLATLASEVPASQAAADARCRAQIAEAERAAMRASILRSTAKYDNVPRTSDFRETSMASAWVQLGLASAQNGLSAYTCSPNVQRASATDASTRRAVPRKIGPR
jgi:hypothetical protein